MDLVRRRHVAADVRVRDARNLLDARDDDVVDVERELTGESFVENTPALRRSIRLGRESRRRRRDVGRKLLFGGLNGLFRQREVGRDIRAEIVDATIVAGLAERGADRLQVGRAGQGCSIGATMLSRISVTDAPLYCTLDRDRRLRRRWGRAA
jgi:hypothetical protein